MDSCPICCEIYTNKLRKSISCKFCNVEACTTCIKKYLLGIFSDPKCMSCNIAWDPEFLDSILSKNFRTGDLKKHREDVLFEREKSMLPDTIHLVEETLERRAKQHEIDEMIDKKLRLQNEIDNINAIILEKKIEINAVGHSKEKRVFIKGCPKLDCRGFLSTQWKCGICETKVCNKCLEILKDDHTCMTENVETAKQLAKDTKNCPKCAASIYKIDGCSQMFCTQCHVSFDWKTGLVNNGPIHNPHYYEWLRKQNGGNIPRDPVDGPCRDQLPEYWTITEHLRRRKIKFEFYTYHRGINHIQMVELNRFNPRNEDNSDLRIKYLLKEIDEDIMKREILRRENKEKKNASYRQIYQMLIAVGTDLMNKILNCKVQDDTKEISNEFEELRKYFNSQIKILTERHGTKSPKVLDSKWYMGYAVTDS